MRQRHDLNDKSIGTELRPGKPQGTGRGLDGNTSQPSNTVGDGVTFSLRTEGVKNASYQNLCDHKVIPAMHRSGGWAQYITVTAADLNCIRLPEGVDTLSA